MTLDLAIQRNVCCINNTKIVMSNFNIGAMIKTIILLCLASIMFSFVSYGQCMMVELPLNLRAGEAEAVIEGSVSTKNYFESGGKIYTSYTIDVHKLFKGDIAESTVELITEGGHIGEKAMIVIPNLMLNVGDVGIFFLDKAPLQYDEKKPIEKQYISYGSAQGCIKYNRYDVSAYDPFHHYENIADEIYAPITAQTGQMYSIISSLPFSISQLHKNSEEIASPQATITTFSPLTVTAGTFTELTIRGSGFGSAGGLATVQFLDADAGGNGVISVPPDHIRSWKDNEIIVWVPGVSGATACTGQFRVVTSSGSCVVSTKQLTVLYSVIGYYLGASFQSHLYGSNGAGGYTFYLNNNFASNSQATAVLQRSMTTWRCATGINIGFEKSPTVSIACPKEDGKNIIAFASPGCPMPQGALGVTYIYPSTTPCVTDSGQQRIFIKELDMLFSTTPPGGWNYGPNATTGNKYDFESVVVHELGHVHQLGHINAPDKLMHYAESPNKDVRKPSSESSLAGALNVLQRSVALNCGLPKIKPITTSNCAHGSPAARIAVKNDARGCSPLTVEFTDSSYYAPTSWSWDADGDGKEDFATRNGSFTYTKPGNYTAKLRVSNNIGFDTASFAIAVDAPPAITLGDDRVICKDSSIRLAASTTNGRKPYQYKWTPETGLSSALISSPIAKPSATTQYIVTVKDYNGCIATDTITIVVAIPQPATIKRQGDTLIASPGLSYRWLFNDEEIASENSQRLVPKKSGRYAVVITDDSVGCTVKSQDIIVTLSYVEQNEEANSLRIFPNPASDKISIFLNSTEKIIIRLYTATGENVLNTILPDGAQTYALSLEALPSGVYLITVLQGAETKYTRFIRY